MEVIADGEHGLAGRRSRNGERLQATVVTERIGDPGEVSAVAADEAGKRAVRAVGSAGNVVDVVSGIDCREHPTGGVWRVGHGSAAGIVQLVERAVEVVLV